MVFLSKRVLKFFFRKRKLSKYFTYFAVVIFGFLILIEPVNDKEAVLLYLNKVQELSSHTILKRQKELVKIFYIQHPNSHPGRFERKKMRKLFNNQKKKIKKKWEGEYGLKWISDPYQIRMNDKNVSFDAHHIIPINAGGMNEWWNLTPLSHINHQKLHASIEEHACFEHNMFYRFFYRFELNIKMKIYRFLYEGYTKNNNMNFFKLLSISIR